MIRWNSRAGGVAFSQTFAFGFNFPIQNVVAIAPLTYTSVGKRFLYTSAEWSTILDFFFEVTMTATSNEICARLYDITAAAEVSGSVLATASASQVRLRTAALTLIDGHEYQAQFGTQAATGSAAGAQLIAK